MIDDDDVSLPMSVSIESVDSDVVRKKFVCKERVGNDVDGDDDASDCGDLNGVEVVDGGNCGGGVVVVLVCGV